MTQRNVILGVEDTYAELKSALNKRGYRVVVYESNKRLVVEQGSLWGISPRAAKKRIRFDLAPADSWTQISASSKISSDWTKTAEIGCVLPVLMAFVCF